MSLHSLAADDDDVIVNEIVTGKYRLYFLNEE